ncbi:MAG: ribosome small subunit-dependent GTPase A [Ferruginibacter sp.]
MQALVYKSTGNWYQLKNSEGQVFKARLKGIFKIDEITSTNPIAVGDIVEISNEEEEENTVITEIYERRNYINRTSPHNKNLHHIVAANLDQSLLFATLKDPKTSLGFIDRFLVISEAYAVPAIIVFNKSDVYREKEKERYKLIKEMYERIGYKVMLMSLEKQEGVKEIETLLKDKVTLLSGHSGVGKSTFINYLFPALDLKTQNVSDWSGKGLHTTTFAEMFDLPGGGKIIDTPGIREMGLVDIPKQELSHYFPEMRKYLSGCKFNNCMHIDEVDCAVKEAIRNEEIHGDRYISYLKILDTINEKSY